MEGLRGEPTTEVLLVEDDALVARFQQRMIPQITAGQFGVTHVKSLEEALGELNRKGYDVILLDLLLPDSRGLETSKKIHALHPQMPVVVLTDSIDGDNSPLAVQLGAEDFLIKGQTNCATIVRAIRHAIERRRVLVAAQQRVLANENDLDTASEIQRRLLPVGAPDLPGFELGGASYPALVTGGDYYDFIPLPSRSLGVAVGDVSGHGFGPALLMSETRAYLRSFAQALGDLGQVLTATNAALAGDVVEQGRFVTLLLLRLDHTQRTLSYASAGHTPGYVLNAESRLKAVLNSGGLPLGVDDHQAYATHPPLQLLPGDMVVLMTDGIRETQSPDGAMFGDERALEVVRTFREHSARDIVKNLYHATRAFAHNAPQVDDITAVIIKVGASTNDAA